MLEKIQVPSLLWLGPVVDERTLLERRAVSPAANRWQAGLLMALLELGVQVEVIGHVPEPIWPRGQAHLDAGVGCLAPGLTGGLVQYWNLPGVRPASLTRSYRRALQQMIQLAHPPMVLVTYNDYPWNAAVGRFAQVRLGIPWCCVVADAPGEGRALSAHKARIAQASGRVFLSWERFQECSDQPNLHLDGGQATIYFDPVTPPVPDPTTKPVLVFAGAMNPWAGSTELVNAFRAIPDLDVELWLCGQGNNPVVEEAARLDPRIRFLGLVEEKRLREVFEKAAIFINPRPRALGDNRSNFPSKVLDYLAYGKPVISTWTNGLCPEYRQVLSIWDGTSPTQLDSLIRELLSWDNKQRQTYAAEVHRFLTPARLWSHQAERFWGFLQSLQLMGQNP